MSISDESSQFLKCSYKLSVLLAVLSENTALFLAPTVMPYFLEFISEDKSFSSISFYVGFQEGLFRIMGLFGSVIWSIVSDKLGRKMCLTITMSGIAISSIGHGLSTTVNTLLFWRVISGLFSGTTPIIKALISDLSTNSNISHLYAYYSSGFGFASIFGPLIGGSFSSPYRLFPSIFDFKFFHTFPFFLPFLIHSLLTLSALVCIMIFIPNKVKGNASQLDLKYFLKNFKYKYITFIYFLHAFVQFSYRTFVSLWIRVDSEFGGLGWLNELKPGLMYCLSGVLVATLPLVITKRLPARFGIGKSIILMELFLIPILIFMPFTNNLDGAALWISLILCHGLILSCFTMITSFISIGISNSVKDGYAGTAFGLAQGITSISRSASAHSAAEVFRKSIYYPFPFDSHLPFFIDCVLILATVFFYKFIIGTSLDSKGLISEVNSYDNLSNIDSKDNKNNIV